MSIYTSVWVLKITQKAAHLAELAEMTDRERKQELKEVLVKYGLGADLETLWGMGFSTHDIAWMSAEEMGGDARLTGSFEQYVAMQEGVRGRGAGGAQLVPSRRGVAWWV